MNVSTSEVKAFRACMRKHHYAYSMRRRPKSTSHALTFGTLIHKLLERWWGHGFDLTHALGGDELVGVDPFDVARARALMIGYHARWSSQPYETIAVEKKFTFRIRGLRGVTLSGKIDAIAKDRETGRTLLVEHKTSSQDVSGGSNYWEKLIIDDQVSNYYEGAKSLGYEIDEVLYDVIKKPQLKPLQVSARRPTAETPEEYEARVLKDISENPDSYYCRSEPVRLQAECEDAQKDLVEVTKLIRIVDRLKYIPRNPDGCFQYGRCQYWNVCAGRALITDDNLFRTAESKHEELAE